MRIVSMPLGLFLAGLLFASGARATDPGIDWCRVPDALVRPDSSLPYLAEAIAKGEAIKIVILGTASSAGAGVSAPYQAYPERLRAELSRRFQRAPISLVNFSQRGWTAVEMTTALDAKVIPLRPNLVIWQTGSVEAVRGLDINQMGTALGVGIEKLRQNRIDVVLVEPQYNPHVVSIINFEPYAEYMQRIADSLEVNLFNRHDIMKHWIDVGIVNFNEPSRALQSLNADQVHGCLGTLLADLVERASNRGSGEAGTPLSR